MCTVSFIKSREKIIITSNRDEQTARPNAWKPEVNYINHKKIIFPQDPKAGGTWFAADENNNIGVLLNGAFEKHIRSSYYRKSRGLILLDIMSADSPYTEFCRIDLYEIEPFTLILYQNESLYHLVYFQLVYYLE